MKRKKRVTKPPRTRRRSTGRLAIAVVIKAPFEMSGRPHGDFAAFVEVERNEAIERAIEARAEWGARQNESYRILVGELTEEVQVPTQFKLTKIKGE